MKKRFVLLAVLIVLVSGFGVSFLQAQGAAPQTYSFTTVSGSTLIKVTRDGPKEVVDQVMLAGPGREKDFRLHNLYDFQAHKIYTKVLSDPSVPCSVMEYTSPAAPSMFDLISGAPEILGGGGEREQGKQVGTETVNGIATNVVEVTSAEAKAKIWIAQQGGYRFPAKLEMRGQDGKVAMSIEMRQLSFAKPPASAFAPMAGCTKVQGQSSATGGHAEMNVGAGEQAQSGRTGAPAGKQAAQTGGAVLLGKWDFTGTDGAGVQWRGTLGLQKLAPDTFDPAKYSNTCDLELTSANSGRGASGPCLYDSRTKTFSFAGGADSSEDSFTAVLSPDGKSLTQGRWVDGTSGNGTWSATSKARAQPRH